MIAGGLGAIARDADAQDRVPGRHAADPARRPGHAHRHGRRRGELDGGRRQRRRARLRFGAARQPRDRAPRAGGHQPLLARSATRNPILAIHDVGAGGLSNAFPELVDGAGRGARFDLRAGAARGERPRAEGDLVQREPGALRAGDRAGVAAAVRRDVRARALPVRGGRRRDRRARSCVAGAIDPAADGGERADRHADGRAARQAAEDAPRRAAVARATARRSTSTGVDLQQAAFDVLRHPTVASKRFLITIGDRTVGGLTHRDQMVGPWQVPVADCAVTLADYSGFARRGDGMGERTPLAALDAPASGRMAVAEAITNLLAAPIELARVKLSAATGWPPAASPGEDAALYDTVQRRRHGAVPGARHQRCRSARTAVDAHALAATGGAAKQVTSPVSLIVTRLRDARRRARHARRRSSMPRRHDAGAGRPRPRPACAWAARSWRRCSASSATRCPTSTIRSAAEGAGRRGQRAARRGQAAGLPRPQRRRPVGGGLRDGVRRPRRRASTSTCWSPKATASPTAAPSTATRRTGPARSARGARS